MDAETRFDAAVDAARDARAAAARRDVDPVRSAARDRARWRARLALVLLSPLVAAGVAEVGLRLAGWGQIMEFVPHEGWGYLMRPSQVVWSYGSPVEINSSGLRGPELARPKRSGSKRVLFVGDSVTYGGGRIREDELFVRVFESGARAAGLDVEAVNVSAPGWSPQNWRGYLEREGFLGADIVVLVLPECDLARSFMTMEMHGFREHAPRLRIVASALKMRDVLLPRPPSSNGHPDPDSAARDNLEVLRWLRERVEQDKLLVVLVPGLPQSFMARYFPAFEAALGGRLDLRPTLDRADYFMDGVHLSAAGHALVGQRLVESLLPALR